MIMTHILLIMIFFMARNVTAFLEAETATRIFNIGYWVMLVSLFPVFVLFIVQAILRFFDDQKIEQLSMRNIKVK